MADKTVNNKSTAQTEYKVDELQDAGIEVAIEESYQHPVVIDFYATWCGPCKELAPVMDKMASRFADRAHFYRMDVDKNKVDDAIGVKYMPTIAVIKKGEITNQAFGFKNAAETTAFLKTALND
jgi:thioredoxin 1